MEISDELINEYNKKILNEYEFILLENINNNKIYDYINQQVFNHGIDFFENKINFEHFIKFDNNFFDILNKISKIFKIHKHMSSCFKYHEIYDINEYIDIINYLKTKKFNYLIGIFLYLIERYCFCYHKIRILDIKLTTFNYLKKSNNKLFYRYIINTSSYKNIKKYYAKKINCINYFYYDYHKFKYKYYSKKDLVNIISKNDIHIISKMNRNIFTLFYSHMTNINYIFNILKI